MAKYTIEITALGELTEADVYRITDAFKDGYAAVVSGGPGYGHHRVALTVRAASPRAAFDRALTLLDRVCPTPPSAILDWRVRRDDVEVPTTELPTFPEFIGVAEVAELLGISKQRAWTLARSPNFPPPVKNLRATPVWLKRSIQDWQNGWDRRHGRPANWTVSLTFKHAVPAAARDRMVRELCQELASAKPRIRNTENEITVQIQIQGQSRFYRRATREALILLEEALREVGWPRPKTMRAVAEQIDGATGASRFETAIM